MSIIMADTKMCITWQVATYVRQRNWDKDIKDFATAAHLQVAVNTFQCG